ncbi:MAG TPA: YdbH domain-containing protein [Salinisphaeraceae bacterium]|nr:YdbH domain-containing protein [Salinisphaeraceae bacterium]
MALDWGSITADGMQAAVDVRWQPGHVQVSSSAPLTVAELDVGVPITQISLQLDSDLQHWQFHDIHASLLDGRVSAAALDWPARDYQPVELANIQVAQLAALQNKPVVNVSGRVGGTVPVRLHKEALSIRGGWLTNATPLSLSLRQSEGVRAMEQANQSVDLALDAINPMQIKVFQARIDMSADGWLDAAMTIKGRNPERGIPVVLNYTHQENMYKLLRSLRISKQIVDTVMGDIR